MPNRLADATSPYLRQHRDNPVDWYPWGDEAFARAEAEDKPVFLSVGYSSCHWCHVMAHESFENPETAARMNARFVNVKLDREERPDVDEAYMAFVQMTAGRGGWPMSVFLTPDKRPFYAGTYWPKDHFESILDGLAKAWTERRADVEAEAGRVGDELARYFAHPSPEPTGELSPALYAAALQEGVRTFDPERGGFGGAPKFPPHTAIDLFLALALSEFAADEERQAALAMAFVTLERMALGGIHDHVGGGFHRYSTDREWLLPHFEKMLYDNALMLGNLAGAAALALEVDPPRSALFARAAGGIVAWLEREMTSPEGLFYSALDADSLDASGHMEEGAFYVWRHEELDPGFAEAYGARPEGNFRDEATGVPTGTNVLHLQEDAGDAFDAQLDDLLARRASRPRPGLDDKCIVAWNGLMIGALADAGLVDPAERAAMAILSPLLPSGEKGVGGRGGLAHEEGQTPAGPDMTEGQGGGLSASLPHTLFNGQPQGEAFLDDVAALADGLFKLALLFESLGQPRKAAEFRDHATKLGRGMIRDFEDPATGAYLSTSAAHETLFGRTRSTFDQPQPSGSALALRVLVAMGETDRARRLVAAVLGTMERAPTATEALYAAAIPLLTSESLPLGRGQGGGKDSLPLGKGGGGVPSVRLAQSEVQADSDGKATLIVVLELPDGLHVNGPTTPARWLTPTRVETRPLESDVAYPPTQDDAYTGRVEISLAVALPPGESGADLEIVVSYQACTDTECLAPVERALTAVVYR